jgi:hypothetical protein
VDGNKFKEPSKPKFCIPSIETGGNPGHSCEELLMENYATPPDLTDKPLENPDLELYSNSSYFVKNDVRHVGFAVVTEFDILKSGTLHPNTSVQLAELVVLTEDLKQSKKQRVNTYVDSKCAFLILHAHVAIWKERGMLTTTGSRVRRAHNILPSWMLFCCLKRSQ